MKILLVVFLAFLSSCLFNTLAYSNNCSDYKQKTGLNLNGAECYVLEQVKKGVFANLKKKFPIESDRILRSNFLRKLLTDSLPNFKATNEGVKIQFASVHEALILEGAKIPIPIQLVSCIFYEEVNFSKSQFSALAHFNSTQFSDRADFYNAEFSGTADFNKAQFSERALFYRTIFLDGAEFYNAEFSGPADFYNTEFLVHAKFHKVQFLGWADFREAQFSKEAEFSGTQFSAEANFNRAHFYNKVGFEECRFKDNSYFKGCQYYNIAVFDDVTGFSNMQIEWEYNPEKFGKAKDEDEILRRGIKNKLRYNETFYIALIKNYRDMGCFKEADDAYYTYRNQKRTQLPAFKKFIEYLFIELTTGYGVKPYRILIILIISWLPFSLYYTGFIRNRKIRQEKQYKFWIPTYKLKRFMWALIFSLDNLTPGVDLKTKVTLNFWIYEFPTSKKIIYAQRIQNIMGWYFVGVFLNMVISLTF